MCDKYKLQNLSDDSLARAKVEKLISLGDTPAFDVRTELISTSSGVKTTVVNESVPVAKLNSESRIGFGCSKGDRCKKQSHWFQSE
jgi:hypothetical protein